MYYLKNGEGKNRDKVNKAQKSIAEEARLDPIVITGLDPTLRKS